MKGFLIFFSRFFLVLMVILAVLFIGVAALMLLNVKILPALLYYGVPISCIVFAAIILGVLLKCLLASVKKK